VLAVARSLGTAVGVEQILIISVGKETDWSVVLSSVDVVVHLAARVHVMNDVTTDPLAEFRKFNVEGTLSLLGKQHRLG